MQKYLFGTVVANLKTPSK